VTRKSGLEDPFSDLMEKKAAWLEEKNLDPSRSTISGKF
jgi:hypothetical protein